MPGCRRFRIFPMSGRIPALLRRLHIYHQRLAGHTGIGLSEELAAPSMSKDLPVSPEIVPGDIDTSGEDESHGADRSSCKKDRVAFFVFFFDCGETFQDALLFFRVDSGGKESGISSLWIIVFLSFT